MRKQRGGFRRADLFLVAALFMLCILAYGGYVACFGTKGKEAEITVDGEVYGSYPLEEDVTIPIVTERGSNTVVIQDGMCYMQDADCPDGLCIRQGKTDKEGASIVCLPHRVVVTITGDGDDKWDTMAQ